MRPGCPAPAQATLSFRYASREAWIGRLSAEPSPEAYDLCGGHATRTQPPHGWQLRDQRPREEQVEEPAAPQEPPDLGGEDTVAVLAAALRAVPETSPTVPGPPPARTDAEPLPEDDPSPVLEQPRVPGIDVDEPDEPDDLDVGETGPRPVPAARDRGIAAPLGRSGRVPHGTAHDW